MQVANLIRRFLWVYPLLVGLVFVGAGAFMISEGNAAKQDVKEALLAERIITANDAAIPGVPVVDVATAQAQSDIIFTHLMNQTGGRTYGELERTDPLRNTYVTAVTLRTALNLAIMGFKVSDLVMGIGAFMIVMGATHVLVLAPALFWLRGEVPATRAQPVAQPAGPGVTATLGT